MSDVGLGGGQLIGSELFSLMGLAIGGVFIKTFDNLSKNQVLPFTIPSNLSLNQQFRFDYKVDIPKAEDEQLWTGKIDDVQENSFNPMNQCSPNLCVPAAPTVEDISKFSQLMQLSIFDMLSKRFQIKLLGEDEV